MKKKKFTKKDFIKDDEIKIIADALERVIGRIFINYSPTTTWDNSMALFCIDGKDRFEVREELVKKNKSNNSNDFILMKFVIDVLKAYNDNIDRREE